MRRLTGLRDGLWLKDESPFGTAWGGNKVRKLEWTLPDAKRRGKRTVLTFGALATNHGLATALYAREQGLRCALALVDQPVDDHVRAQLERLRASGATLHFTHTRRAPWPRRRGCWRATACPTCCRRGGSSPVGALGLRRGRARDRRAGGVGRSAGALPRGLRDRLGRNRSRPAARPAHRRAAHQGARRGGERQAEAGPAHPHRPRFEGRAAASKPRRLPTCRIRTRRQLDRHARLPRPGLRASDAGVQAAPGTCGRPGPRPRLHREGDGRRPGARRRRGRCCSCNRTGRASGWLLPRRHADAR